MLQEASTLVCSLLQLLPLTQQIALGLVAPSISKKRGCKHNQAHLDSKELVSDIVVGV